MLWAITFEALHLRLATNIIRTHANKDEDQEKKMTHLDVKTK